MPDQHELFDVIDEPEQNGRQPVPYLTVLLHFAEPEDRKAFEEAIGRPIPSTDSLWFPRDPEARSAWQ